MSNNRQLADAVSGGATSEQLLQGRRNLIINGAMQVAQRGTSFSGVTGNQYTLDRFNHEIGASGTWTVSQSSNAPSGFYKSLRYEVTSAATQGESTYAIIEQRVEKLNLTHLAYGTADAKPITLSFWVRSNVTGERNVNAMMVSDTSPDRALYKTYTINAADTWEFKTITFAGDTQYAVEDDIGTGSLQIEWWLGGGTTFTGISGNKTEWTNSDTAARANETANLAATVGNYIEITGVQLELGSVATPFEHRSYGEELALCQWYFEKVHISDFTAVVYTPNGDTRFTPIVLNNFRVAPSVTPSSFTDHSITFGASGSAVNSPTVQWNVTVSNTDDSYYLYISQNGAYAGYTDGIVSVGAHCHTTFWLDAEL